MAPFLFAKAIRQGRPIDVFNHGHLSRDFTYIDDVAESVLRVCDKAAEPDPSFRSDQPAPDTSTAPFRIFNVGNSPPEPLLDFIGALESALGRTVEKNYLPLQPGDVPMTAADTAALQGWIGFRPATPMADGVRHFADWYVGHYPESALAS
jgi:UDP-glucuronate 4-epimerase